MPSSAATIVTASVTTRASSTRRLSIRRNKQPRARPADDFTGFISHQVLLADPAGPRLAQAATWISTFAGLTRPATLAPSLDGRQPCLRKSVGGLTCVGHHAAPAGHTDRGGDLLVGRVPDRVRRAVGRRSSAALRHRKARAAQHPAAAAQALSAILLSAGPPPRRVSLIFDSHPFAGVARNPHGGYCRP